MQTVLITGGAGFIGSNLADHMLEKGWKVLAVDNFDPYYRADIKHRNIENACTHGAYRFIEMDIQQTDELIAEIKCPIDVIIHLAAKAGVRYSITNPIGYEETNVQGTIKICEIAKILNVPQIIFASSSSVYGNNPSMPWSEDSTPVSPVSPYAKTKVMSEEFGKKFSEETGIYFKVLRFFSVYGPRMRPDLMMYKIAKNIIEGNEITVFGDGSSKRDYTFIEDIVSGIMKSIDYKEKKFDIFNLGSNNPITLEHIISIFEELTNKKAKIKHAPFFKGESNSTAADTVKSQKLLGYSSKTTIDEGILLLLKSSGII